MKVFKAISNGTIFVLSCILAVIGAFLIGSVITATLLGFTVLTVSIFSTVPAILSNSFWVMFLIVNIPVTAIIIIVAIVKYFKGRSKARKLAKELMKTPRAKEEVKAEKTINKAIDKAIDKEGIKEENKDSNND